MKGPCLNARKKQKTIDEQIMYFCLHDKLSPEDFVSYFNENIKQNLVKELQSRQDAKKRTQEEWQLKKAIAARPENALTTAFIGRKSYPTNLSKVEKKCSINDLVKIRRLAIDGKLNRILGGCKNEFVLYLNAVLNERTINTKKQESKRLSTVCDTLKELLHGGR